MSNHDKEQKIRLLRCVCEGVTYCLEMSVCKSMIRVDELCRENNDNGIVGWVNFYNNKLPVLCLSFLLGQSYTDASNQGKILVLSTSSRYWCLLVDDVESAIECESKQIRLMPSIVGENAYRWFEGIVMQNDSMLLILSPEGLMGKFPLEGKIKPKYATEVSSQNHIMTSLNKKEAEKQIVLFSALSDMTLKLGLSLLQISKVTQPSNLYSVQGSYSYVLGIFEWNGMILPLLNLPLRLGDSDPQNELNTRWLIVRVHTKANYVGFAVRPRVEIRTLPLVSHVSTRPLDLDERMLKGKFELHDSTLLILDTNGIISPEYS